MERKNAWKDYTKKELKELEKLEKKEKKEQLSGLDE